MEIEYKVAQHIYYHTNDELPEALEKTLNKYGNEGWNNYHIERSSLDSGRTAILFFFKRTVII